MQLSIFFQRYFTTPCLILSFWLVFTQTKKSRPQPLFEIEPTKAHSFTMTNKKTQSAKPMAVKSSSRSKYEATVPPTTLRSAALLNAQRSPLVIHRPNGADILFGRGGESNNAEGNRKYQKVIEESSKEYSALTGRKAKTQFAWKIYSQLREEGARFLKKEKGDEFWTEAPEEACRKKISQRLRERALEARDKQEHKRIATSTSNRRAQVIWDDVALVEPVPEPDFEGSDGSIESLVDFADNFPASWMTMAPEPVSSNEPLPSMCTSAPLEQPDHVMSLEGEMDPVDPFLWQSVLQMSGI